MKTIILSLTLVLVFWSATSHADDAPKIVINGMEAYKTNGFGGAFDIWLKGSPLENDKKTMTNLKGALTEIETMYGKMKGYEVLRVVKISSSTIRTYAEIRYEKGPLFLYMDCYKTASGFIVPMMRFHTESEKVLPQDIFEKKADKHDSVSVQPSSPAPAKKSIVRKPKKNK